MSVRATTAVGVFLGGVLTVAIPGTASAHAFPGAGDFFSGMLHPVTALEMLLAMVALGALAGQQGREAALRVLASFPVATLLGGAVGVALGPGPAASLAVVVLMVVLGLCLAVGRQLPLSVPTALALALGLGLGAANGAEVDASMSAWRFVPGVALAGLLTVAYTVGIVRWLRWDWSKIAVRVLGSWIAAAGIMVLALRR